MLEVGDSHLVATDPVLSAECLRVLPSLKALALQPASRDDIRQILARRFAIYAQPERTEGEWVEWWSDYLEALDGLSASSVEAGMAAYVRLPDSEFFPKPGRLRELAKTEKNDAALAYHRANTIEGVIHSLAHQQLALAPDPVRRPIDPAEQEQVRRMLRDTIAALTPPEKAKPDRPGIHAKVDETGISPELRKLSRP